jgi:hypothetical protein
VRAAAEVGIVIDDGGQLVVRVDPPKVGCQIVTFKDVVADDAVVKRQLFQGDRDLLAVGVGVN